MGLTPEQKAVLATIKDVAREKRASPKQVKAAIETGLVESGLRNLKGGDADSAGWRQERASLYPNPTDVRASAARFFDETAAVKHKYGSAGDLAAAVQRPAAQYRGRYQQQSSYADTLMGRGAGGGETARRGGLPGRTISTTTPGVDNSAARRAAVVAFLGERDADPLSFAMQVRGLQDTPGTTTTTTAPGSPTKPSAAGGTSTQQKLISRAHAIDKKNNAGKLPYQWGGGHGGKVNPYKATPLDCSGAVSSVLELNPRVSGEFERFGKPGEGGTATIYANPKHVLMKIRGRDGRWHFFGTSASNPGGGAGWIPADKVSPDYLKNFTARHI